MYEVVGVQFFVSFDQYIEPIKCVCPKFINNARKWLNSAKTTPVYVRGIASPVDLYEPQ